MKITLIWRKVTETINESFKKALAKPHVCVGRRDQ